MDDQQVGQLFDIPPGTLKPIVGQILGTTANPIGRLSAQKVGHSLGQTTVGIYRIVGNATTSTGEQLWSAVVKVLGQPAVSIPGMFLDSQREIEVYRSGVFSSICGGIRAAQCYAIQEKDGLQLMWLEDLSHAPQPPWSSEQYIETAYHLGQFNGYWPSESLPDWRWLNHGSLRQALKKQAFQEALERLHQLQSHPVIAQVAPPDIAASTLQLWDEIDRLLEKVEQSPKGICHLDCHPRNLFPMHSMPGKSYTVAVDWAEVGIGPYGIDVGHLLIEAVKKMTIPSEQLRVLIEQSFEAYINGLTEVGWAGNVEQVRLTYLTRIGGEAIRNLVAVILAVENPEIRNVIENLAKASLEETAAHRAEAQAFLLSFKDVALQLADRF